MRLEAAEGNIVKFLKEIYLSFTEYATQKNYKYEFNASQEIIKLFFDRAKLERVFFNLISNAFKYTPEKGEITINVQEQEHEVVISITDTGIGIPEAYREKVFERFFEVPSKTNEDNNKSNGSGIGLSIVQNIVNLHKGNIQVLENPTGTGSMFIVKLHKGKAHLKHDEIVENFVFSEDIYHYKNQIAPQHEINNVYSYSENIYTNEKTSVLIVEDNLELRAFIRDLLAKSYNIYEAGNGKEAYKLALKEQIDLIISDVIMPVTTGTELCALIKQDIKTSHIPVILLTTRSELIYKLEGLEYGADDYISKPFNIQEFQLRINNLLNSIQRLKQKIGANQDVKPSISSLDEKLYQKAINIIKENISNEHSDIPYFCKELGISKSVLYSKVKAWSNFTPKQFILNYRLNYAAQLLESGKMNINQISQMVGFKDPKYFARVFKNKFDKTPTEYVKYFTEF